jgi:hypothetical protein
VFMKLFLNDFNVFNDLNMHLDKLWLCFDKCKKFSISLNLEKCMFLVYLGGHAWVCCFQGGEITWSKKYFGYLEYAYTENTKRRVGLQWDGSILLMFHQEFCFHYGPHHGALMQNKVVWMHCQMLKSMGGHKTTIFGCTDFSCT